MQTKSGSGGGGGQGSKEAKPAQGEKKKGFLDSGFVHGLLTGDGSGPENNPATFRQDARDDIHRLAKANGTAASEADDSGGDVADRAAVAAAGRQAELGRNLPAAALRAAVEVDGTTDTKHKINGALEGLGVKIHNFFVGKIGDKVLDKSIDKTLRR